MVLELRGLLGMWCAVGGTARCRLGISRCSSGVCSHPCTSARQMPYFVLGGFGFTPVLGWSGGERGAEVCGRQFGGGGGCACFFLQKVMGQKEMQGVEVVSFHVRLDVFEFDMDAAGRLEPDPTEEDGAIYGTASPQMRTYGNFAALCAHSHLAV